ncbi:hypothetical protein B0H17DRAFT_519772 [Mycena rosella]|uniref:Uncharacterized protein n=1 Tax=Mycena rosella TaxID=1033263 RepID=A0AAD7GXW1_MYCRO|nr:hypothetical protein B0H17DRAFT_519772 [Mycena rosella]
MRADGHFEFGARRNRKRDETQEAKRNVQAKDRSSALQNSSGGNGNWKYTGDMLHDRHGVHSALILWGYRQAAEETIRSEGSVWSVVRYS